MSGVAPAKSASSDQSYATESGAGAPPSTHPQLPVPQAPERPSLPDSLALPTK